jgi:hypothetical protein
MNDLNNRTDDTSPTFKAFEEGSETMSKTNSGNSSGEFIRFKKRTFPCENKTYGFVK